MALLNYAISLSYNSNEVENYIGLTSSDPNYLKLVFTGDGHIITHGVDYTADYNNGKRGLVPNYSIEKDNHGVFTKTGWTKLTTSYLPLDDSQISVNNLWSSEKIVDYIADGIAANDAMVTIGTVDGDGKIKSYNENYLKSDVIGKDFNSLTNYSSGWTFRVVDKGGTIVGKTVEIGDMIMCVSDSATFDNSHWSIIQTNINGKGTLTLNGENIDFYTDQQVGSNIKIFAPTTAGTSGQVLISSATVDDPNKNPVWVDQSSIDAGKLSGVAIENLLTNVTATNGVIKVTVGGTSKSDEASGDWNINAASASRVNNTLKTSGDGLTSIEYNGSSEQIIKLLAATKTTLGGVKADDAPSPTITIDNDGKLRLSKENVINALGYEPETIANSVIVSDKYQGIAPKIIKSDTNKINSSFYLLAYNPEGTEVDLTDPETGNTVKGREANWYKFSETWRPVSINGTQLFNNSNTDENVLDFVNNDFIHVSKTTNANTIQFTPNYSTFTKIKFGETEVAATGIIDTLNLVGDNITITNVSNTDERKIQFSVAKYAEIGSTGLIHSAENTDATAFMQADGTWTKNTYREIKVGSSTLSSDNTSGALTITADKDIAVSLNTNTNTLTISSTYTPMSYIFGTGLYSTTSDNKTTVVLAEATSTTLGGIKIAAKRESSIASTTGKTESDRYYGVEIDSDGKAFVNVPWTDTNIRDIQINKESIGTAKLNIIPSEDIHIIKNKNETSDVYEIGFGLNWYNISIKDYETTNN